MIERMLATLVLCLLAVLLFGSDAHATTNRERIINCDKYRTDELISLACNIYHEARGESQAGQWLVALVTRNRVKSNLYPNTYAEVVREIRVDAKTGKRVAMFSWYLDGKHDWVTNQKAWLSALLIAARVMAEDQGIIPETRDFTYGCMWYHNINISPYWKDAYYPTIRIQRHQCYTSSERSYLNAVNSMVPTVDLG